MLYWPYKYINIYFFNWLQINLLWSLLLGMKIRLFFFKKVNLQDTQSRVLYLSYRANQPRRIWRGHKPAWQGRQRPQGRHSISDLLNRTCLLLCAFYPVPSISLVFHLTVYTHTPFLFCVWHPLSLFCLGCAPCMMDSRTEISLTGLDRFPKRHRWRNTTKWCPSILTECENAYRKRKALCEPRGVEIQQWTARLHCDKVSKNWKK